MPRHVTSEQRLHDSAGELSSMGLRFSFSLLPTLLPGETILFFQQRVWLSSGKSFPSYRIFFTLPPCFEAGLYVTDRRVLLVAHVLRLFSQEFDQWFAGRGGPADDVLIQNVTAGRSRWLGPYLEIASESSAGEVWYRSRRVRVRLYMRNAEAVQRVIAERLASPNHKA
jgi:hypothetical protein